MSRSHALPANRDQSHVPLNKTVQDASNNNYVLVGCLKRHSLSSVKSGYPTFIQVACYA